VTDTDIALVERAKGGDDAAFEELYVRHKQRAYSVCLRMTRDPTEAEDLTQEVFLKLYRKLNTFRGDSAFTTWFHRLVINTVLMHLRKRNGHEQISLDELIETEDDEFRREIMIKDSHLEFTVERILFHEALEQLAPGYRTVLYMHDVEGYEHGEIATVMGTTAGCSKSQLCKARTKLLSALNPLAILSNFEQFLEESNGT
jgi:RNA polymerase sigma-70 factor (ECF subfamily)